jgi:hypothetical protein
MTDTAPPTTSEFDPIGSTPVTHGVVLRYGVENVTITGILVDSYSRSVKFAGKEEIVGQDGTVQGLRMNDIRVEISISGRLKEGSVTGITVGSILVVNGDHAVIDDINLSAGSKDFTKVDIKATSYQAVSGLSPAGLGV